MAERHNHIILRFRKDWQVKLIMAAMVTGLAIALMIGVLMFKFFQASPIWSAVIFVIACVGSYALISKPISQTDVSSYLDKTIPSVEESSSLLLKPEQELSFFERRQVERIQNRLVDEVPMPRGVRKKLRLAVYILLGSVIVANVLFFIPFGSSRVDRKETKMPVAEKLLPGISRVYITVIPPAYTGRTQREFENFNIEAEEESLIQWTIETNRETDSLMLIFNDSSLLQLEPGKDGTSWTGKKSIKTAGYYQVRLGNELSDYYRIDVIKDQLPEITVHTPAHHSVIEPWMPHKTTVNVTVKDDYGVRATAIVATIASGSGESVAFREQSIYFSDFSSGSAENQLKKQLDLNQLKMTAGDELYFYVIAVDTRNKEKRSDIYVVRIEDTAQLMSLEGLSTGIDIKPEFFRSQRQIIIETEQLLKDRSRLSREEFNSKSNELGVDQKLLRLRYGKFLGEETDVEIGAHAEEPGHEESAVEDIMDSYMHKHDNAEDATFFDAETKKQLKATLTEMWKAELQLRSLKPNDALPFEYKALRLLKDLQQKTRAYVSKTGIKTTPLDLNKRLSADQEGIQTATLIRRKLSADDKDLSNRRSLGILEQLKNGETLEPGSIEILHQASIQISAQAAIEPARFLSALTSIRNILKNEYEFSDLQSAERGILELIKTNELAPVKLKLSPDMKFSDRYFKKITGVHE